MLLAKGKKFTKTWCLYVSIGHLRFARFCSKMRSHHQFLYGGCQISFDRNTGFFGEIHEPYLICICCNPAMLHSRVNRDLMKTMHLCLEIFAGAKFILWLFPQITSSANFCQQEFIYSSHH